MTAQGERAELLDDMSDEEDESKIGSEISGYTILPDITKAQTEKAQRKLAKWLAVPDIVHADIEVEKRPVEHFKHFFSANIYEQLKKNGITYFFPVQCQVVPAILGSLCPGSLLSRACMPPSDICCSAPTGSGKTLAFVLPIVQALQNRVVCRIRALVLLPVSDLALQVYRVFQTYTASTKLKVGLTTGQTSFSSEQAGITHLDESRPGTMGSSVDILISTPGRLVDHINCTAGFDLSQLRFLVLDEVDRILDEVKQDWLNCVERAVYSGRGWPAPITARSVHEVRLPLQKLLFSATLTENPEKLEKLNLLQPRLFTSVVKNHNQANPNMVTEEHFIGKFTTPAGLQEFYTECRVPKHKPYMLLFLLKKLDLRRVLVFASSQDTADRLHRFLCKYGVGFRTELLSGALTKKKRARIIKQFGSGSLDVLITTDVMARGMDVSDILGVISYDCPSFIKTYIHRVGRTARAGKSGVAYTILQTKEIPFFRKMMKAASKKVKAKKVRQADVRTYLKSLPNAESEAKRSPVIRSAATEEAVA